MRALLLALLLVVSYAHAGSPKAWRGFPIPAGAEQPVPPSDTIAIYEIARPVEEVTAEVRAALKKGGWTIESEEAASPGGMFAMVKKGKVRLRVKVAAGSDVTGLVLRLPNQDE
jgi:hypothetical protein